MTITLGRYDCARGYSVVLATDGDLLVRTSSIADAAFIDKMQRDNSYAVGFIQRTVWDRYVFGGERNFVAFVCEANHDPVGYVLVTPGRAHGDRVKIQQVAIRDDARRLAYGSLLVEVVSGLCRDLGRVGVTLRCRADLEANTFWSALGFRRYGVWDKGRINHVGMKASEDIYLWALDLYEQVPQMSLMLDQPSVGRLL